MKSLYLVTILALTLVANTKTTTIKAVDETGAPFPNVLIIVKSLDERSEIARHLTGPDGRTPRIELGTGLYRVIVTCPYGPCRTAVREVLGSNIPLELAIPISVNPSDLNGEIVGGNRVRVVLEARLGKAKGVHILVRDEEARWEKWYVADSEGTAEVELPADKSVIVVIHDGKVFTRGVSTHHTSSDESTKRGRPVQTEILRLY